MGKPYTLRVAEDDEAMTQEIAAYVDGKIRAFRKAFPKQAEVTSAVIVALALAEELFTLKEKTNSSNSDTDKELDDLSDLLDAVLSAPENGVKGKSAKKGKRTKKGK